MRPGPGTRSSPTGPRVVQQRRAGQRDRQHPVPHHPASVKRDDVTPSCLLLHCQLRLAARPPFPGSTHNADCRYWGGNGLSRKQPEGEWGTSKAAIPRGGPSLTDTAARPPPPRGRVHATTTPMRKAPPRELGRLAYCGHRTSALWVQPMTETLRRKEALR